MISHQPSHLDDPPGGEFETYFDDAAVCLAILSDFNGNNTSYTLYSPNKPLIMKREVFKIGATFSAEKALS